MPVFGQKRTHSLLHGDAKPPNIVSWPRPATIHSHPMWFQSPDMTPMLRRLLALALLPLSAADAAPCNVTDRTLLGSWEAVGKSAAFEQMAFELEGAQREFDSWRHERPEISQAHWHLEDCKLTIRESSSVTQTFTVLFRGKRLLLSAMGGQAAGSYQRIEERR